jgi:F0F1-type ATP synthase membrane subunit a
MEEEVPVAVPSPKKKVKKTTSIASEISSGIKNLFETITQRVSSEIKEMSSLAEKDFRRLATSLFFFMLGAVFISIGLVKFLEYYLNFDAPVAYSFIGLLLLFASLVVKNKNKK